jgi:hypothetical protein
MLDLLKSLLLTGTSLLKTQRELALENLALRQQLAVLSRSTKPAKLNNADRAFWLALKKVWPKWSDALVIVKPATVITWHRRIFKEYIDSYYNPRRTHIGLGKDCPVPRAVDPPENGNVVSLPILGGLHHHYSRKAA